MTGWFGFNPGEGDRPGKMIFWLGIGSGYRLLQLTETQENGYFLHSKLTSGEENLNIKDLQLK
ncbi:hypothetical protein NQU17_02215 [Clostridiaceae bacterium HFYG-1003]|nr:hypothetical protein NQU17_02215 [Clostridiaceae bacterium HFYG-1003]